MTTPSTPNAMSAAISWLLNLATRMLANSLNMPAPLVHSTGIFVYAQVQAVEHRAARTLCPVRLLRWLREMVRRP
jgi:hypothetical protein